jgi:hypothetical protein
MYLLLIIAILVVILYVIKSNVEMETFKNIGKKVFSQVRKVNLKKNKNKNKNDIAHDDEVNTCKENYKFENHDYSYRSKYDSNGCIPCKHPPKCSEHNYKCIDEYTGYNVQDNCVEDGICRINEDVINMYPVKTCIPKK